MTRQAGSRRRLLPGQTTPGTDGHRITVAEPSAIRPSDGRAAASVALQAVAIVLGRLAMP